MLRSSKRTHNRKFGSIGLFGTQYYDQSVGKGCKGAVAGSISNPSTINLYVYVGNDPRRGRPDKEGLLG